MRKLLPADHGLLPRIMSAASTPEKAAHRLLLCQYAATVIGPTQEQQRSSRVGNQRRYKGDARIWPVGRSAPTRPALALYRMSRRFDGLDL
jgi:hypothetical protein